MGETGRHEYGREYEQLTENMEAGGNRDEEHNLVAVGEEDRARAEMRGMAGMSMDDREYERLTENMEAGEKTRRERSGGSWGGANGSAGWWSRIKMW